MESQALGLIETIGLAAAIEAADTAVKSANVELIGYELTRGKGMVTVKIQGNVGAVKAALQSAMVSAKKVNRVYATLLIPRPAENIMPMVKSKDTRGFEQKEKILQKDEDKNDEDNEDLKKHDDEDVCNLCGDKSCPRRKGQPRSWCIHYGDSQEVRKK